MKGLPLNLVLALVTFSIGVGINWVFTARQTSSSPLKAQVGLPVSIEVKEFQAVSSIPIPVTPQPVFDYDPKKFDPRGDYFIIGRKPKAFPEFDCFELAVDDFDGRAAGDIMIQTYENQTYNAHYDASGLVTKERLIFIVPAISDVDYEYRFDGYFLREGVLSDAAKNMAVVKGKLSKTKQGVKIAEAEIRLRVEYLGC